MDKTGIFPPLPQGHVRVDGREYVAMELFEAANRHVLEQGIYCNQLVAVMNDLGATIRKVEAERARLAGEVQRGRTALLECERTQQAMRAAVYGAAEGL
jgi:hypothetical protein